MDDSTEKMDRKKSEAKESSSLGFASFLERAAAFCFDFGLLSLVLNALLLVIQKLTGIGLYAGAMAMVGISYKSSIFEFYFAGLLIWIFLFFSFSSFYFAHYDSSKAQASLGKKLLRLTVGDAHLKRITFTKAVVRHFAKLLSGSVFGVGFLLVLLSERKQALHDFLARTYVTKLEEVSENKITMVFVAGFVMFVISILLLRAGDFPLLIVPTESEKTIQLEVKRTSNLRGFFEVGGKRGAIGDAQSSKIDDDTPQLKDVAVLYDPLLEQFEFHFFSEPVTSEIRKKLEEDSGQSYLNTLGPVFSIILGVERGATSCDSSALRFQRYVLRSASIAKESLQSVNLVPEFTCEILRGSELSAQFRNEPQRVENQSEEVPSWNISVKSPILFRGANPQLTFESTNAKEIVALLNSNQRKLQVGFFRESIDEETQKEMGRAQSLELVSAKGSGETEDNFLLASIDFYLEPESEVFNVGLVSHYVVRLFRNEEFNFVFPGEENPLSIRYTPSLTEGKEFSNASGVLQDGQLLKASLENSAQKTVGELSLDLAWNIEFEVPLRTSEGAPPAVEDKTSAVEVLPRSTPTIATLTVDNEQIRLEHSIALYYPESKDVAIGFYFEPLTTSERAQVKKNKLLWPYVNGKRPNFAVVLNFKRDSEELSFDSLISYSTYFLRDRHGRLYFPGAHDRTKFNRAEIEFEPNEIEKLDGEFKNNSTLEYAIRGSKTSKMNGSAFTWSLEGLSTLEEIVP